MAAAAARGPGHREREMRMAKHAQRMVRCAGCTVEEVARALQVDRGRALELLRIAGRK